MLDIGTTAPSFRLNDHLGRTLDSAALKGRRHILICFYPLDFTPT